MRVLDAAVVELFLTTLLLGQIVELVILLIVLLR